MSNNELVTFLARQCVAPISALRCEVVMGKSDGGGEILFLGKTSATLYANNF